METAKHAERMAHGVCDSGSGGVEGDTRQRRRNHHVTPRVEIVRLGEGAGQGAFGAAGVARDQTDGVQPIGVGHGIAAPHRAGLDGVNHRIDPGSGGERGRQGNGQSRIEKRQVGPQGLTPGP